MRWWEVLLRKKVLSAVGNMRRSDFVYSNLFQGSKQYSVNIEYLLKSKFKIYNGDQDENGSVAMKIIFIDGEIFYWVVHENCYLVAAK